MALTAKQERFIQEYLIDLNATQAAIRAGYSPKTAKVIGHENLTKPDIKVILESKQRQMAHNNGITAEYVLKGIKGIADNSERDMDRLKAFELLGRNLKLFTEKIEHSGETGVRIVNDIPRNNSKSK